jgi:CheY-like chemotaxis protein
VLNAADLRSAVAIIGEARAMPHGLLVDYHLDDGNGIEAIVQLRWRLGSDLPAILITADRSPHVRAAAREENIAVLNKPLKPASLRALLGQWRIQQMVAAE